MTSGSETSNEGRVVTRREFLHTSSAALAALSGLERLLPPWTWRGAGAAFGPPVHANLIDLTIGHATIDLDDRQARVIAVNGSVPGPLLRFREGETMRLAWPCLYPLTWALQTATI